MSAVLFDLDETLFDHTYSLTCGLAALREEIPPLRDRPIEDLAAEWNRSLDDWMFRIMSGETTWELSRAERIRSLVTFCGGDLASEQAAHFERVYGEIYRTSRRPVEGAGEFVTALRRNHRIAIVTNNLTAEQTAKLTQCGLEDLIDVVITSEDVGFAKPNPAIFDVALRAAGARPEEAVMVGDSWENDVVGALNAGIAPVWFNRFGARRRAGLRVAELDSYRPIERALDVIESARLMR